MSTQEPINKTLGNRKLSVAARFNCSLLTSAIFKFVGWLFTRSVETNKQKSARLAASIALATEAAHAALAQPPFGYDPGLFNALY
jgi:hypothetical protein